MSPLFISDAELDRLRRSAAEPDLAGSRYELRGQLGRGGMATVYRAWDAVLDREVALKVLDLPEADPALAARLLREARVLAQLEHPGIVPVHDAGELPDGRAYCAMKRVEGSRLDDAARELTRTERLRLFLRICDAVAFAHSRGILHRDLKPENVMVGSFGEVLVLDWGLARIVADLPAPVPGNARDELEERNERELTRHGAVLGTPAYMPPEQSSGVVSAVDQRSDVFALGGILQFLLTDAPPSAGAEVRIDGSKALAAACSKARALSPDERYPSARELAGDIERFLDGRPLTAYRESLFERGARLFERYQTATLLVLAYLFVRTLLLLFARQ
ncbi:MAG: serine/threonine-protein kinase [Thermoanaerobaculia bacterium]